LRVNKAGAAFMGLEPKEAINKNLIEFLIPDKNSDVHKERTEIIGSGVPKLGMVTQISLPSGGKRWVQYDKIPYYNEYNNSVGIIVFMQDITQQKLAEENLEKGYKNLQRSFNGSIEAMAKMVELRDPYTSGHQRRVACLASDIAREMNLSEEQVKYIHIAGIIHDCGKINIPSDILSKPTKLTEPEFQIIKTHSRGSWEILKSIEFPWPIANIALQHHERLNGSGYPNALKGEDILIEAKILAVADVVEAMASHRPYRPALGLDRAEEEISRNANILYDSTAVEVCIKLINKTGFQFG
jgi:PAS domain S-box-containing protein/putative nucleotidyltransferase with HDIG domain